VLYKKRYSIRVYFTVQDDILWMLALDPGKHKQKLEQGMESRLLKRLDEVRRGNDEK